MKKADPIGVELPFLEGNTLQGIEIPLPYYKKGEIRIGTLVLTAAARKEAREWTRHILDTFKENPEIHYFEIRYFSRVYKPFADRINDRTKSMNPPELHPHVATAFEGKSTFSKKVGINKKNTCQLFVLDRKGLVRFWTNGAPSLEKQRDLMAEIHRIYQRS